MTRDQHDSASSCAVLLWQEVLPLAPHADLLALFYVTVRRAVEAHDRGEVCLDAPPPP